MKVFTSAQYSVTITNKITDATEFIPVLRKTIEHGFDLEAGQLVVVTLISAGEMVERPSDE